MERFALFVASGFEETEALGVVDLLRRAGVVVDIVSSTESLEVESAHNIILSCDLLLGDIVDFGVYSGFILPGGLPGVPNLMKNDKIITLLQRAYSEGKLICAICAAPSILGNIGLLDNKKATVYPGFENEGKNINFTGNGVEVADNIITAKGLGYVFDFALTIIEKIIDKNKAIEIANAIQYRWK